MKFWIIQFWNLLFPNLCVLCEIPLEENHRHLCVSCRKGLPYSGSPRALLRFEKDNAAQSLIHEVKYRGNRALGHYLGEVMGSRLVLEGMESEFDLIIPVPLHKRKKRKRGFNQSEHLARGIEKHLGVPVDTGILKRHGSSGSQTSQKRFERWKNVENVFGIDKGERLKGKRVLLVDDVITTGATLGTCIRLLEEAGASSISPVTLAEA